MASQSSAPSRSIPPLVIRSAIVASLGGLLFGFDTAVISGAEEKLTELYALSSTGEGMIVAIATIGTIVGAIIAGNLADRFGRKPVLFWIGILFGVGHEDVPSERLDPERCESRRDLRVGEATRHEVERRVEDVFRLRLWRRARLRIISAERP